MIYYIIFIVLVAVYKTDYYIHVEEKEKFKESTMQQLRDVYKLTFVFGLIFAPVIFIELVYKQIAKAVKGLYNKIKKLFTRKRVSQ